MRYAQIQDDRVHWIFESDEAPDFAPYIVIVSLEGHDEVHEGWSYKDGVFSEYVTPPEVIIAQAREEADALIAAKSRANMVQTMSFTAAEFSLLAKAELFPVWTVGETYPQGRRIQHEGIVYEVVSSGGVTAQEHQPPSAEGMLAVYRPLSVDPETGTEPDGTQDDPIPYLDGMDVVKDKYYSYNGKLYKANLTMPACVWPPDTAGLWQWTEVTETA